MSYTLNTNYKSKLLILDSQYATIYNNGTSKSDLIFVLKDIINVPTNVNVLLSLQNASIPLSFYIIGDYNNYIKITQTNGTTTTKTFTKGNYTASDFVTYWNSLGTSYTLSFSTITNKFTFTNSNSYEFTISSSSTCLDLLGFSGSSLTSSSYVLTSDTVCNFAGERYLIIETNLYTQNIDSKTGMFSPILMTIPLDISHGGVLTYQNQFGYKSYINEKTISFISIKIYDADKNLVNFNNKDFYMLLQFDFVSAFDDLPPPKTLVDTLPTDIDNKPMIEPSPLLDKFNETDGGLPTSDGLEQLNLGIPRDNYES